MKELRININVDTSAFTRALNKVAHLVAPRLCPFCCMGLAHFVSNNVGRTSCFYCEYDFAFIPLRYHGPPEQTGSLR